MTKQELITKCNNTDEITLNLIEKILNWRNQVSIEQATNFTQIIINVLNKHGEINAWENVREQLIHKISQLNVERNKIRKDKENIDESLKKKKQWFDDLEKSKKELENLTEKESNLRKDDIEMQNRYVETKHLIKELEQNHKWLSPQIKESINKIWASLPLDELDKALTK